VKAGKKRRERGSIVLQFDVPADFVKRLKAAIEHAQRSLSTGTRRRPRPRQSFRGV
jgi:hypothetical protein